jgi:hypothetical protein
MKRDEVLKILGHHNNFLDLCLGLCGCPSKAGREIIKRRFEARRKGVINSDTFFIEYLELVEPSLVEESNQIGGSNEES